MRTTQNQKLLKRLEIELDYVLSGESEDKLKLSNSKKKKKMTILKLTYLISRKKRELNLELITCNICQIKEFANYQTSFELFFGLISSTVVEKFSNFYKLSLLNIMISKTRLNQLDLN